MKDFNKKSNWDSYHTWICRFLNIDPKLHKFVG